MVSQGPRRHRLLALLLLAAAVLVSVLTLTRDTPPVSAEALVIAHRLDVDPAALPRYGAAVFHEGQVAQAVRDQLGLAGDHQVIPEHATLITPADGILFRVVGHGQDPQTAVDLANGAADAFTAQLNEAGQGVGQFAVQRYAQTATTPEPSGGTSLPLAVAAALALAGLLLLRRPSLVWT